MQIISKAFIIILVSSCDDARTTGHPPKNSNEKYITLEKRSKKEAIFNQDSSNYYINILSTNNEVHSEHIGFGGSKSPIYSAYEKLRDNLSIDEIFPLLQHDSPAVRVYAYYAVIEKDSTMAEQAWKEIKGKDDPVITQNGCSKWSQTIQNIIKICN